MGNVLTVPYTQTKNSGYRHMLFSGLPVHLPSLRSIQWCVVNILGSWKGWYYKLHLTRLICCVECEERHKMLVTGYMKHPLRQGRRKGDSETQRHTRWWAAVQQPPLKKFKFKKQKFCRHIIKLLWNLPFIQNQALKYADG